MRLGARQLSSRVKRLLWVQPAFLKPPIKTLIDSLTLFPTSMVVDLRTLCAARKSTQAWLYVRKEDTHRGHVVSAMAKLCLLCQPRLLFDYLASVTEPLLRNETHSVALPLNPLDFAIDHVSFFGGPMSNHVIS